MAKVKLRRLKIEAPKTGRSYPIRFKHLWRRLRRDVIHVRDTPHRVAWGFAIGMLIAWLPIVGVQMAVSVVLCFVVRANILASIPPIWISNPVTMVPMYWLENQVGAWFAGTAITWTSMQAIWSEVGRISGESGLWDATLYLISDAVWPAFVAMAIGGTLIGVLLAIPSYVVVRRAVEKQQLRVQHRRKLWEETLIRLRPSD